MFFLRLASKENGQNPFISHFLPLAFVVAVFFLVMNIGTQNIDNKHTHARAHTHAHTHKIQKQKQTTPTKKENKTLTFR